MSEKISLDSSDSQYIVNLITAICTFDFRMTEISFCL